MFVEIAVDGGFEIADGAEDAAPEPAPGKCSEEALDRIQPGAGGGDEVESEALVPGAESPDKRGYRRENSWVRGAKLIRGDIRSGRGLPVGTRSG